MGMVMKQLIDRFANMEKIANETLAADPGALVGVNDMPGSEHDAKVPADAKKPDEEVTQGQPAGATTAEGAVNGGDAKPLNEGKLEVNQPLDNPEQKPLVSDDALSAKEASANLDKLTAELLSMIKGSQKQAQANDNSKPAEKSAEEKKEGEKDTAGEKKEGEKKEGEEKKAAPNGETPALKLDDETLSKIAAATATYMAGRKAAEDVIKKAAEEKANAISLIKAACVKAAQEAGLDPQAAALAADNAMAAAGVPAAAADDAGAAGNAEAAAADAGAAEAAAADAGDVQIPSDVTEEELGEAIVDLVQSGELDPDTAKALVDEIAGDEGAAGEAGETGEGITEDQAAEIIAGGLESGEITPEQAKELVDAIEAGDGAAAGAADADAAAAEAQGAADAEAAAQDAADEAQGAADAEAAMKQAAAAIRQNAISKVASAVVKKREQVKKAEASKTQKESPLLMKVASILKKRKEEFDAKAKEAEKSASAKGSKSADDHYMEGFKKKASELGVDPVALARYVTANKAAFEKASK